MADFTFLGSFSKVPAILFCVQLVYTVGKVNVCDVRRNVFSISSNANGPMKYVIST